MWFAGRGFLALRAAPFVSCAGEAAASAYVLGVEEEASTEEEGSADEGGSTEEGGVVIGETIGIEVSLDRAVPARYESKCCCARDEISLHIAWRGPRSLAGSLQTDSDRRNASQCSAAGP